MHVNELTVCASLMFTDLRNVRMLNSDELYSMYVDNREATAGGPYILTRILGYFKNSAIETVMWRRL